jgi:hypothetical protein
MKAKNLLQIIPTLVVSAAMATTTLAAGKVNPEAVSKGMLTALNNQVGSPEWYTLTKGTPQLLI